MVCSETLTKRSGRRQAETLAGLLTSLRMDQISVGRFGQGAELGRDGVPHQIEDRHGQVPHRDLLAAADVEDLSFDAGHGGGPQKPVGQILHVVELPGLAAPRSSRAAPLAEPSR